MIGSLDDMVFCVTVKLREILGILILEIPMLRNMEITFRKNAWGRGKKKKRNHNYCRSFLDPPPET